MTSVQTGQPAVKQYATTRGSGGGADLGWWGRLGHWQGHSGLDDGEVLQHLGGRHDGRGGDLDVALQVGSI